MLLGVEIWDLNDGDLQALESEHLQMARMIQGLPQNIAKADVLVAIAWTTVLTVIYKSCCKFIGRFLNASSDSVAKRVTLQRLHDKGR